MARIDDLVAKRDLLLTEAREIQNEINQIKKAARDEQRSIDDGTSALKQATDKAERYERLNKALKMRVEGKTYKEIGQACTGPRTPNGVGANQARQLVFKAARILLHKRNANHPMRPLAEQFAHTAQYLKA